MLAKSKRVKVQLLKTFFLFSFVVVGAFVLEEPFSPSASAVSGGGSKARHRACTPEDAAPLCRKVRDTRPLLMEEPPLPFVVLVKPACMCKGGLAGSITGVETHACWACIARARATSRTPTGPS